MLMLFIVLWNGGNNIFWFPGGFFTDSPKLCYTEFVHETTHIQPFKLNMTQFLKPKSSYVWKNGRWGCGLEEAPLTVIFMPNSGPLHFLRSFIKCGVSFPDIYRIQIAISKQHAWHKWARVWYIMGCY